MAAKKNVRDITPSAAATTQASTTSAGSVPPQPQPKPVAIAKNEIKGEVQWDKVVQNLYNHYVNNTPQRIKLVDAFMVFLVVVGVLQFVNCALAGTFPFNAFLSGFCVTVGQFVLTASLRLQTNEAVKNDCPSVSPERFVELEFKGDLALTFPRAFADYIVCSLILHFFAINFIN
ncbi:DAD family-domain-containing protein [Fusarium redolens]|uniref:Dolichyl-diphosphooligosaccharide--protein glycosyltransferase subunit OST2 n=1 Tax=Fusarium redolens TaxID=48865 RepID=A0A9P9R606_FUSRE|nr:DAD family-domain-containing protein [Fusarium redolens]KAH7266993.1 DAD family-domain-containing protein [Fusarium redolens]